MSNSTASAAEEFQREEFSMLSNFSSSWRVLLFQDGCHAALSLHMGMPAGSDFLAIKFGGRVHSIVAVHF
jgi:hypothetical protein